MIDLHYNQSYHGDDPRTERPYRSGRNKRFKYAVHHQLGFIQSMVNLYIVLALILFQSYPGCHALISSTSKPTAAPTMLVIYQIPSAEFSALEALYNSTHGEGWNWLTNYGVYGYPWQFNTSVSPNPTQQNPCSTSRPWQGLTCSNNCHNIQCHITGLALSNYGLRGSLPNALGELSKLTTMTITDNPLLQGVIPESLTNSISTLRTLSLDNNGLSGKLPNSFYAVSNSLTTLTLSGNGLTSSLPTNLTTSLLALQVLDLSSNMLTGSLSSTIGDLKLLLEFDIASNMITGRLPATMSSMTKLQQLLVHDNMLTGEIPLQLFSNFPFLLQLEIDDNQFTGNSFLLSSGLTSLTRVQLVYYDSNFFSGSLPATISNMKTLGQWTGNNNLVTGSIPVNVTSLKRMTRFWMEYNFLSHTLPSAMGLLSALTYLDLGNNILSGTLPDSLCQLTSIQNLYLDNNRFHGPLPQQIGNLQAMLQFSVAFNSLSQSLPTTFYHLQGLRIAYLYDNSFSGTLSPAIGNMTALTSLEINDNFVRGTIPPTITSLSNLRYLFLYNNSLTGTLPSSGYDQMTSLWDFFVEQNYLSGTVPESLFLLPRVQVLLINQNLFSGTISESIGLLPSSLRTLQFDNNYFRGTIPKNLTTLTSLISLLIGETLVTGTIPQDIGNLVGLRELKLYNNHLTGSLPDSLYNCVQLTTLSLYGNELTGTISKEIDRLLHIQYLGLYDNHFSGTIPDSLCYTWKVATQMYFLSNHFTGTIPACYAQLRTLQQLEFTANHLTGTIPQEIFQLPLLQIFYGAINFFTGTLSSNISSMTLLSELNFAFNMLTGTLPASISTLPVVGYIYLNYNEFEGEVPKEWFTMPSVQMLYLFHNQLTGNITAPSTVTTTTITTSTVTSPLEGICTMKLLQQLDLHGNYITGTIPSCLIVPLPYTPSSASADGAVVMTSNKLKYLYLYQNHFSGNFSIMPTSSISISTNRSSSSSNLQEVLLNDNMLSSALHPSIVNAWTKVQLLNLSNNFFTSSLPLSFQNLTALEVVDLSSNTFSGSLSNLFTQACALKILFLQYNSFDGPLTLLFGTASDDHENPSQYCQESLVNLDISGNQLQGTLPREIFLLSNLSTFAAAKNCITGSIPFDTICLSKKLQSLALDGLHTADSCQVPVLPRRIAALLNTKSYTLKSPITGSIPLCVFTNISTLQTLHLSGNAIDGIIPNFASSQAASISPSLKDLSLSHNNLKGSIPIEIQRHAWTSLDLSFNKIGGSLTNVYPNYIYQTDSSNGTNNSSSAVNSTTLKLEVNRLSGFVPPSLYSMLSINILKGNVFDCRNELQAEDELPKHDSETNSYRCGSSAVNDPLYAWIVVIVLGLGVVLGLVTSLRTKSNGKGGFCFSDLQQILQSLAANSSIGDAGSISLFKNVTLWWNTSTTSTELNGGETSAYMVSFSEAMKGLRTMCQNWTMVVLIILLPLDVIFSAYYSTLQFPYVWVVSLAYKHGVVPAITFLVILTMIIVWVESHIKSFIRHHFQVTAGNNEAEKKEREKLFAKRRRRKKKDHEQDDDRESEHRGTEHSSTSDRESAMSTSSSVSSMFSPSSFFPDFRHSFSSFLGAHAVTDTASILSSASVTTAELLDRLLGVEDVRQSRYLRLVWMVRVVLLVLFNIAVVMTVNACYVYATTQSLNAREIGLITVTITVFKIFWNNVVVAGFCFYQFQEALQVFMVTLPLTVTVQSENVEGNGMENSDREQRHQKLEEEFNHLMYLKKQKKKYQRRFAQLLMSLSLFNSVIAPCLAVLFVSPECFYFVLVQPPPVSASYTFQQCVGYYDTIFGYICVKTSTFSHSTSYSPAFNYSYQCSSSLLSSFADVFLYRFLISSILIPSMLLFVKTIQERRYKLCLEEEKSKTDDASIAMAIANKDWLYRLLTIILPIALRPVDLSYFSDHNTSGEDIVVDDSSPMVAEQKGRPSTFTNATSAPPRRVSARPSLTSLTSVFNEDDDDPTVQRVIRPLSVRIRSQRLVSARLRTSLAFRNQHQHAQQHQLHDNEVTQSPLVRPSDIAGGSLNSVSARQLHEIVNNAIQSENNMASTDHSTPVAQNDENDNITTSPSMMPADAHLVFLGKKYVVLLVGDLAILLTFGTIFPPLAAVICLSIVLNTSFTQLMLGRFLFLAQGQNGRIGCARLDLLPYVAIVKKECSAVGPLLAMSLPPITVLASIFWSFFLFEMLGDVWGTTARSVWIVIFLPAVLLLVRTFNAWLTETERGQTTATTLRRLSSRMSAKRASTSGIVRSSSLKPAMVKQQGENDDDNAMELPTIRRSSARPIDS